LQQYTLPSGTAYVDVECRGWGSYGNIYVDNVVLEFIIEVVLPSATINTFQVTKLGEIATGLILDLAMNEGSGSVVHDTSGNGFNGTIYNATWVTLSDGSPALDFNGSSSYIMVPHNDLLNTSGQITISALVGPYGYPPNMYHAGLVGKGGYDMGSGWETLISNLGNFEFNTNMCGAGGGITPINQCHRITVTFDGTTATFYVDGSLTSSTTMPRGITANTSPLYIGCRTPGNNFRAYFDGVMSKVKVFNRVLTQSEIRAL
jgi:hypothetical protein